MTHQQSLLFIGSCFSEHIANKLLQLKFKVNRNPFGIVFNPKSIELSLQKILTQSYFTENDIFEKDSYWFSLDAHSSINAKSSGELLSQLNQQINTWHQSLKTAQWLVITMGSAYAYHHFASHKIVANCHKLPHQLFEKQLLEPYNIVTDYSNIIEQIKGINPNMQVLLTVSPVKHLKDGVIENSLSKAILIQAIHQLVGKYNHCNYFPAYELVVDDLRDYRFYEADMAHPNEQAIHYVWQKFNDVYFSDETKLLNDKINDIHVAMKHRPFNESQQSFKTFKSTYLKKCENLKLTYPWLELDNELRYFK